MSIAKQFQDRINKSIWTSVLAISLVMAVSSLVQAGPREQAKRIHDRIAGVPPDNATLSAMAACLDNNSSTDCIDTNSNIVPESIDVAVAIAMQNKNFYNVTLKNMVTPWTNKDRSVFRPLNDYTALVIGVVRDDLDFRQILTGNLLYVAGPDAPTSVTAGYSSTDNDMYEQLEASFADLGNSNGQQILVSTSQSGTYSGASTIPAGATAGVMTTRAGAAAFFYAGTNRAMFRFTALNHLCNDLEALKDITRPNDRVRQDVTRSPGGDGRIYLNNCVGCHAGMDGMMGAFAYYDWIYDRVNDPEGVDGHLIYKTVATPVLINTDDPAETTDTRVVQKFFINYNNFIDGHVTQDDGWVNYWRNGPNNNMIYWNPASYPGNPPPVAPPINVELGIANATFDNKGNSYGSGAKQLGAEVANSRAFAECQVKKVYRTVCHGEPGTTVLSDMAENFMNPTGGNYRLKSVFTDAISRCSNL